MRSLCLLLVALMLFASAGCGSSNSDINTQGALPPSNSLTRPVEAARGGTVTLAEHELVIPPGSLSRDTTVSLATLTGPVAQPPNKSFQAVGTHLEVALGDLDIQHRGVQVKLPAPPESRAFPVQVANGLFIPLENAVQADGGRVVKINAGEFPRFQVGYVVGGIYPAHKAWGTYNGYVYDHGLRRFKEFINQGQLVPGQQIPDLGERPAMIVHGLGSNISGGEFADLAQFLLDSKFATGVVGFEYDTLDSVVTNGIILKSFYDALVGVPGNQGRNWLHIAHSMGCVVSRQAMETQTLPIPPTGNQAFFLCGTHLGSEAINVIRSRGLSYGQRFVRTLVLNLFMEFTNGDGSQCEVELSDLGFYDIANGSPVLAGLNRNAAQNHPAWTYGTLGGDDPGGKLKFLEWEFSVYLDDGLVNLVSANYDGMGAVVGYTAQVDHLSAPSAVTSFFYLKTFLQGVPPITGSNRPFGTGFP